MLNWEADNKIESEADKFASYLLMPLHDFRSQISGEVDLLILGECADRYGVSLTAAILKWLEHTDEKAVVVHSKDGFMNWSFSSNAARKSGAFFRTKQSPIPLPIASIANDPTVTHEKKGRTIPARVWFQYAEDSMPLREMKLFSDQYDSTLSLLVLPKSADVWKPSSINVSHIE